MEKVSKNQSASAINLRHIRNLSISSFVMEVVAVTLGFVAFWLVKDTLAATISGNNISLNAIANAFMGSENIVSLILVSLFGLFTFIAFFLLPTITICHFGKKLETENKNIFVSLVLSTPVSLVFLPLVVLAWPIAVLTLIGPSESALKKELTKVVKKDYKPQNRIIDLTVRPVENKKSEPSPIYKPGQNSNSTVPKPVNTIYIRNPKGTL